jgi:hypothetical protein
MVVVVWTPRRKTRHIISMRYCHAKEAKRWQQAIESVARPDDAPELTDDFFRRANWYPERKLVRRGRRISAPPRLQRGAAGQGLRQSLVTPHAAA